MEADEYEKIFRFLNDGSYVKGMNENEKRRIRKRTDRFTITEGKLYYKGGKSNKGENKLVTTKDKKLSILKLCHINNGCHLGIEKTFYKLSERYYWKGMSSDLKDYIKKCQQCQQCQRTNHKVKTNPTELQPVPVPKSTWKKIGIDLIGPYTNSEGKPISTDGYRYVLTVIDYFSNYVEVFPLKKKEASEVSSRLYDLFCRQGVPLELVSDNGKEFNSRLTASLQEEYGYNHILITPYHPKANGRCECYNQTLKPMLNKTVEENASEWEKFVQRCAFAYNTSNMSKQASTKYSPFYLMYWRNPIIPNENQFGLTVNTFESFKEISSDEIAKVVENMNAFQKRIVDEVTENVSRQQEKHNVENNAFKKGDMVLVENMNKKKTLGMAKWLGPYIISDIPKLGTITLIDKDDKIVGKYRQNNMKKYNAPEEISTTKEKSDNEEEISAHGNDINNITNENNNLENDPDDSLFITKSSYMNKHDFDIGIEDLMMTPPSPIKGVDDMQTESDEEKEFCVSRPKRKRKMFSEPMEEMQTEMVTILSCPFCEKTYTRQSTMTRHIQAVHGPMINCVHPKCNYSAPQSKPQQLQQHMSNAHNVHFYKDGTIDTSTTADTSDPRMVEDEKERICSVLRDSVLNLCRENYNSAVEVDGLICISVLNSKDQHVVKIHDLLTEDGQINTGANSHSKNNSNHKGLLTESNSTTMDGQPHPMLVVQNTTNIKNSKKSQLTNSAKIQFTIRNVKSSTKSQLAHSIRNKRQTTSTGSEVTLENSARFPFLVQTLQESHKNLNNRASSASPTIQSANSTVTDGNNLYGRITSSPVLDSDRPASNLLKILSSHNQQTQQEEQPPKHMDNSLQSNQIDLNVSVKQEPVEEENETSQDIGHNSQSQLQENSDLMPVKNEPIWNEAEYGCTSDASKIADGSRKSVEELLNVKDENRETHFSSDQNHTVSGAKSILANILNGTEESYTKSKKGLASSATKPSKRSLAADKSIEKSDEQDNSLLYRLPFVTFQDLFPEGPKEHAQKSRKSDAVNRKQQGNEQNPLNLDKLMRKLLEGKAEKKNHPPRKKRKIAYDEMADFSPEVYHSEEDYDSPEIPSDKDDDNYVPLGRDLKDDDDEHEFSMSLRKNTKKKASKRSVAVKSTTKHLRPILPSSEITNTDDNQSNESEYRYACFHCQLKFKVRQERDQHEEENCINELILCHVCKGYFANTSSRNKHLFEIHSILADEQKEEIRENRPGALEDLRPTEPPQYEFETLKDVEQTEEIRSNIKNISSIEQPQFDFEALSGETDYITTLVTKFIVPYSVENSQKFIKCPLCVNMFSDLQTKDEHLRKKHRIAHQIDNGDGTVSLQVSERTPSNRPPVFVKFEQNEDN